MTIDLQEEVAVELTALERTTWAAIARSLTLPPAGLGAPLFRAQAPKAGRRSVELAPGIWIVHAAAWEPASVLERNSELPLVIDPDEAPRRSFPHPEWHQRAACRTAGSAAFFGEDDTVDAHPMSSPTALAAARAICRRSCSETRTCLTWALTQVEEYGVWAGTSGRQREKLQARIKGGELVTDLVDEVLGAGR